MSKGFECNKIYKVSKEWRDYFDSLKYGKDGPYIGYHYVEVAEYVNPNPQIVSCAVINKNRAKHPYFNKMIPFKFSDVEICSLSSISKLKLFKISISLEEMTIEDERYIEAVVVAENEEEAKSIHPNGEDTLPNKLKPYTWVNTTELVEVKYLGDYYGKEEAGAIICSRKLREE